MTGCRHAAAARRAAWLAILAGCTSAPPQDLPVPPHYAAAWEELIAAEDARIRTADHRATVTALLESEDERLRALAVRALGRTERSEFADEITPLLRDPAPGVRAAAAHALAYISSHTSAAANARGALLDALASADAIPAAAIAESLGRLPADTRAAGEVAGRITPLLSRDDESRGGALRGTYFLARQRAGAPAVRNTATRLLQHTGRTPGDARERGLAIIALAAAGALDDGTLTEALGARDPQIRRTAVSNIRTVRDSARAHELLNAALADPHPLVRHAALTRMSPFIQGSEDPDCAALARAARDTSVHVARTAILLLGASCRSAAHVPLLDSIIAATERPREWHRTAQATIALALADPGRARPHVHSLARHPSPFARVYAAHSARHARDTALLHALARDPSVNVRTAAINGLAELVAHAADSVYLAQLDTTASELLMTAAEKLSGSTHPRAPEALLDAFDRVSALRSETSRDARVALLHTIRELGSAQHAPRLRRYLRDFDEQVVTRVVDILHAWTGVRPQGAVQPLPPLPLPTYEEAVRLARSTFVLEMQGGGEVRIRLLPFDAPTNAARFARLARAGYYDGLTIHRVEPDFVVQGGSPGANEYSGDGPYTRDELGVSNLRGTVGLSTRGRDTGDAQFYINLVDNVRLDHQYTIFGIVTEGMDVVDALLEGAVIRRVREQPG